LGADSQYLAIVARHFPDLLKRISAEDLDTIFKPVTNGEFNTLSAAYTIWALKNYSQHIAQNPPELNIAALDKEKKETQLSLGGKLVRRADFPAAAAGLRFSVKNASVGFGSFYQIVEAGFDRALPSAPITRGLEIYREFIGGNGEATQTAQLGQPLTVQIKCRTLDRRSVSNVAVIDLLPGGFEIVSGSLPTNCDYVDSREDRAVFYTTVGSSAQTISYRIKPTNRGEFVVPPPYAESMYDRTIQARGVSGKITVVEAK
ncbi:MAG: alpha-2-macroglobulin family protein, partial [Chthoniobacterales bacterium]